MFAVLVKLAMPAILVIAGKEKLYSIALVQPVVLQPSHLRRKGPLDHHGTGDGFHCRESEISRECRVTLNNQTSVTALRQQGERNVGKLRVVLNR